MKAYALRHKVTGEFMPAKMFRMSSRGYSHWSPPTSDKDKPHDANPRLFFTRKGAENARVMWAAGPWTKYTSSTADYFGVEYHETVEPVAPPAPRSRDDLEIVVYELVEVTP